MSIYQRIPPFPFTRWLQMLAPILLLFLLVYELMAANQRAHCWQMFNAQLTEANVGWLLLALGLMPLNWATEMKKWHPMMHVLEPMSGWKAMRAVMAGVSVSLFTPNRVGEFAGRLCFVRPENRSKAMMVTLVGNLAQIFVSLSAGIAGAAWALSHYALVASRYTQLFSLLGGIGMVLLGCLYFNIGRVVAWSSKITALRGIKCFVKVGSSLEQFGRPELFGILKWSALRYLIYATQYFCLLRFFGIQTSLVEAYSAISTLFLIQTSMPLPPLAGLVARGNLAMFVWAQAGANELSSLSATFALWIINLILPALVGTFSILYVNTAKTFVYENDQH